MSLHVVFALLSMQGQKALGFWSKISYFVFWIWTKVLWVWNDIRVVLSRNWVGFVVKTWQPWCSLSHCMNWMVMWHAFSVVCVYFSLQLFAYCILIGLCFLASFYCIADFMLSLCLDSHAQWLNQNSKAGHACLVYFEITIICRTHISSILYSKRHHLVLISSHSSAHATTP